MTRVIDGLRCEVVDGRGLDYCGRHPTDRRGFRDRADAGVPTARAALGSCLALTYMMWASKEGIAIQSLAVEVQADFDDGVLFGTSDGVAGYTEVRYRVSIKSQATEADIVRVLDEADRHSAYRDVFARPQRLVHELDITAPD